MLDLVSAAPVNEAAESPQEVTAIDHVAIERRVLLERIADLERELHGERASKTYWIGHAMENGRRADEATDRSTRRLRVIEEARALAVAVAGLPPNAHEGEIVPALRLLMVRDVSVPRPVLSEAIAHMTMARALLRGRSNLAQRKLADSADALRLALVKA